MAIGKNILTADTLIKKTTGEGSKKASKVNNKSNVSITSKIGQPSGDPGKDTYSTTKMTFYIKNDLYDKLKNFAYQDRHTLTEAFNLVVSDGLKGKNTQTRG